MEEKKKKRDKDLEYIIFVWHRLPWWLKAKIYLTAMWYAKTRWFREIPIRWVEYQIRKESGKSEDLLQ